MHALIEATRFGLIRHDIDHPHLVYCIIDSEKLLNKLCVKLDMSDIRYKPFCEPDLGNRLTAIATEPVYQPNRKHFSHLRLAGE